MDVQISELSSTVRAMDGGALIAPRTLAEIVRIVLEAVEQREQHRAQVQSEQRITSGVRDELEGET